jgi:nucleolar protein 15
MNKKIAAQLEKLKGEEWDSDSEVEEETKAFEQNSDFVQLEQQHKVVSKKTDKNMAKKTQQRSNVIYLGRIPHGFYEKEMNGFFKQFGRVVRLRLSRNKRSGKSKHYAFIQFEEAEVAEIVANTMNGYRLFDHTLSCHVIPSEAIHERMFVGANKKFKPLPWQSIARRQHNAEKTYEQAVTRNQRLVKNEKKKRKILQELGIDYEFSGYAACMPPRTKHIMFE